jgi:hypothetical protein
LKEGEKLDYLLFDCDSETHVTQDMSKWVMKWKATNPTSSQSVSGLGN